MEQHLRRLLLNENPWMRGRDLASWFSSRLPKPYVSRRLRLPDDEAAMLVVGPRQVGKSTLIWKTLAEDGEPALYLNCEEPSIREWLRSPVEFLADLETLGFDPPQLYFEEIQALDEAGLFLKGLIDRRFPGRIYATGSSSFDLQARTRESLAGRARRHLLLAFSLDELVADSSLKGWALDEERQNLLDRLVLYGGYPTVHLSTDPHRELAGLVEAFIVRDASDRFEVRHPRAFRGILDLAASQIGNLVNMSEWAALTGISHTTVGDYCQLLEESHILRFVRPFIGGKRAEITHARKVFFLDNGIRNQLFGGFAPLIDRGDRGALYENFVFTELSKTVHPLLDTLRYWRSKSGAEVDFVVEHQGRILACEVKAGDARGNLSRSARSFIDAYRPELFLIVNQRPSDATSLEETRVEFVAPTELARRVRQWLEA